MTQGGEVFLIAESERSWLGKDAVIHLLTPNGDNNNSLFDLNDVTLDSYHNFSTDPMVIQTNPKDMSHVLLLSKTFGGEVLEADSSLQDLRPAEWVGDGITAISYTVDGDYLITTTFNNLLYGCRVHIISLYDNEIVFEASLDQFGVDANATIQPISEEYVLVSSESGSILLHKQGNTFYIDENIKGACVYDKETQCYFVGFKNGYSYEIGKLRRFSLQELLIYAKELVWREK
jgi:hypothetical protein